MCIRGARSPHVPGILFVHTYEVSTYTWDPSVERPPLHAQRVGWAGKFFDQPMIVVVNAMLAEYLRTSSIGFLLHSRKIANILRLRDIADSSKRNTSGNLQLREIAIPRKE